jgi:hypothetical protein
MGVQSPPVWTPPPPPQTGSEKSALGRIVWFAVISIVAIVAGATLDVLVFASSSFSSAFNLPQNATSSQVSAAIGPIFQNIVALVPVIAAIQLAGMVILTTGFRQFRKTDPGRFSLPSTLMLVLIVGAVIAVAGAVPLLNDLPGAIAQAPHINGQESSAFTSAVGNLILFALIMGLGGLLALIGAIGGMILGLWRVGSMYDETLIKVGAILLIIPLLDILAPILILIGASSARGRLGVS